MAFRSNAQRKGFFANRNMSSKATILKESVRFRGSDIKFQKEGNITKALYSTNNSNKLSVVGVGKNKREALKDGKKNINIILR